MIVSLVLAVIGIIALGFGVYYRGWIHDQFVSSSHEDTQVLFMPLESDLHDEVTDTDMYFSLGLYATNCEPGFVNTTRPNGVAGDVYYNPCATSTHRIETTARYTGSFTFMVWARFDDVSDQAVLFHSQAPTFQTSWDPQADGLRPYLMQTTAPDVEAGFAGDFNQSELAKSGAATAESGVWRHYAGTFSGGTWSVYVNGTLSGTQASVDTAWDSQQHGTVQVGGAHAIASALPLVGNLWRARVYNTALSEAQILEIYDSDKV